MEESLIAFASESEAVQWLLTRVLTLEGRIIQLERDLAEFNDSRASEIAEDRRRIAKLEKGELQPAQQDRSEVLRALLVANGGKMLAKDARHKMHLGKATFSVLLKAMKDEIDKKPLHSNRSMIIISLK